MSYSKRFYLKLFSVFLLVILGFSYGILSIAVEDTESNLSDSVKNALADVSVKKEVKKGCVFKIDGIANKKGDKATVSINLQDIPNRMNAFGFDLLYDINALKFHAYSKGDLIPSNYMFGVNEIKDGVVRVGGFRRGSPQLKPGDSGTLIKLEFKVMNKETAAALINDLSIINKVDDIRGWSVCS